MDADEATKKRDQKQKDKNLPFKKQEFVKGSKKEEDTKKKGKAPVTETSSVPIK